MMPNSLFEKALEILQAGHLYEAKQLLTEVLDTTPDHIDSLHLLGVIAHKKNDLSLAIELICQALKQNPEEPVYLYNLGLVYQQDQQSDQAITCFKKALKIIPSFTEALNSLGSVLLCKEEFNAAISTLTTSLQYNPQQPEVINDLGLAHHNLKDYCQAIDYYKKSLAINPNFSSAYLNLGNALLLTQDFNAAILSYRHAINLSPDSALAHNNLGHAYSETGNFGMALTSHINALQIDPTYEEAYTKQGFALQGLSKHVEAVNSFRQALQLQPESPNSHFDLGTACLLTENLKEGWHEYEWRLKTGKVSFDHFDRYAPRWDGTKLNGKTIVLCTEQGYGDMIQFARYIPLVAEKGGKVILVCRKELVSLFKNMKEIRQVIRSDAHIDQFDTYCPLMSLPLVFGTEITSIPNHVPYLTSNHSNPAPPPLQKPVTGSKKRIGLVWAGNPRHTNDHHRSIPVKYIIPLLDSDNTSFFSLQTGAPSNEKFYKYEDKITDLSPWLYDFSNTASAINSLDHIITVDTAVAHLAGAMAKPTWLLLPYVPEWRWLLDREDSPWYPTMRLFRQPKFGDWQSVIDKVISELKLMTHNDL